jgi:hypothetical protein
MTVFGVMAQAMPRRDEKLCHRITALPDCDTSPTTKEARQFPTRAENTADFRDITPICSLSHEKVYLSEFLILNLQRGFDAPAEAEEHRGYVMKRNRHLMATLLGLLLPLSATAASDFPAFCAYIAPGASLRNLTQPLVGR